MKSTIINGDCLEEMRKIPDNSIKLIITDPPYSLPNTNFRPKARLSQKTFGDFSTYVHFFKQFIIECKRVLREDGDLVLFCDEVFYAVLYPILYQEFYASKMVIWDKGKIGMGGIWRRQFEIFVHSYLLPKKEKSGDGDVLKCSPVKSQNKIHFSQKPVELLKKIITKTTSEGDFVLDPFMGSGSVIVACKELNRESIGIELSEEVYNRAKERLSPTSQTKSSNEDFPNGEHNKHYA